MKKPYEKGDIRRVRLVPSEAVLLACKGQRQGLIGPGGWEGMCIFPTGQHCYDLGS